MNNQKNRACLLGIAGGYLVYLAYDLFRLRDNPDTTMTPAVRIIFIVLFVVLGAGIVVWAFRMWKDAARKEKEGKTETPPENENSLK